MDQQIQEINRLLQENPSNRELLNKKAVQQCRLKGHKWSVIYNSPDNFLYAHFCVRCLVAKGKYITEVELPELLTCKAKSNKGYVYTHSIRYSNYRGLTLTCNKQVKIDNYYGIIDQILEDNPVTCIDCIRVIKTSLSVSLDKKQHIFKDIYRFLAVRMSAKEIEEY